MRTDYRGVVALVVESAEFRRALGLHKVPHYSTLAHASRRILAGAGAGGFSAAVVRRARERGLVDRARVAAVDATGLEPRHVGAHFGMRGANGSGHRQRAWPKLTVVAPSART